MDALFIDVSVVDLKKPLEVQCLCGTVCRSGLFPIQIWIGKLRTILYSDTKDTCPKCGQEMIGPEFFATKETAFAKADEIRKLVNTTGDIRCLNRYKLLPGQLSKVGYDHNKSN